MRTLFTTKIDHIARDKRAEVLDNLVNALHDEFPAYLGASWSKSDKAAAIIIQSMTSNAPEPTHLDGWGHGLLTLTYVG